MANAGTQLIIGSVLFLLAIGMSCEEIRIAFFRKTAKNSNGSLIIFYNAGWILMADFGLFSLLTILFLSIGRARSDPAHVIIFLGIASLVLWHVVECRTARLVVGRVAIRFESVWRNKDVPYDMIGCIKLVPSYSDAPSEPYLVGKDGQRLLSLTRFWYNPELEKAIAKYGIAVQIPMKRSSKRCVVFWKCASVTPALIAIWLTAYSILWRSAIAVR